MSAGTTLPPGGNWQPRNWTAETPTGTRRLQGAGQRPPEGVQWKNRPSAVGTLSVSADSHILHEQEETETKELSERSC